MAEVAEDFVAVATDEITRTIPSFWLVVTLLYTAFIIYGSLVPLHVQAIPVDEALNRFLSTFDIRAHRISRTDLAANVILALPLSFLWMGVWWRRFPNRVLLSGILVIVCSVFLSVAVEYLQQYFPPRNSSLLDVLAQSSGALVGVLLWFWKGEAAIVSLARWQGLRSCHAISYSLLRVYLFGLFLYSVLPLDLVLTPAEIYQKWHSARVQILPFRLFDLTSFQAVYQLATDVLMWAPVGFLWVISGRKTPAGVALWVLMAAFLIECVQLLVHSRVSDTTDIVTALLGTTLGTMLGSAGARSFMPARGRFYFALALIWMCTLIVVFWYPFEFHMNQRFLEARWHAFWNWPFSLYYSITEIQAISSFLNQWLMYGLLGTLFALAVNSVRDQSRLPFMSALSVSLLILFPLLVELGEIPRPLSYPDSTNWLIAACGGLCGFYLTADVCRKLRLGAEQVSVP